jgi:hypothetical protein
MIDYSAPIQPGEQLGHCWPPGLLLLLLLSLLLLLGLLVTPNLYQHRSRVAAAAAAVAVPVMCRSACSHALYICRFQLACTNAILRI